MKIVAVISQVITCAIWFYLGWRTHKNFGSHREKMRYYRMGLKNSIFVWAKVVGRQIRREKKEAK